MNLPSRIPVSFLHADGSILFNYYNKEKLKWHVDSPKSKTNS